MSDVHPILKIRTFQQDVRDAQVATSSAEATSSSKTEQPQEKEKIVSVPVPDFSTKEEVRNSIPIASPKEPDAFVLKEKIVPPAPPKKITPFAHEPSRTVTQKLESLSQELSTAAKPFSGSILTDEDTFEDSALNSGTIIRDTKRKRFKLIPAMFFAARDWFNDTKETYTANQPVVHTIAKSDTRATAIEKAVKQGEQAPHEDFKVVADRLKHIERKPVSATLTFKSKEEVPKPSWAHVIEDTAQMPASVPNIPPQEESAPQTTALPQSAKITEEQILETYQKEESSVPEPMPLPDAEEVTEISLPQEITPAADEDQSDIQEVAAIEIPEEPRVVQQQAGQHYKPSPYVQGSEARNIPIPSSFVIGTIVAVCITAAGIGYVFLSHKHAPAQTAVAVTKTIPISSLLQTQSHIAIPLAHDRTTQLQAIRAVIGQSNAIAQIYPETIVNNSEKMPASTAEILQTLSFIFPPSFGRSIREVDFGGVDGTDPYLVLRSSTFDIAFSGMLAWEPYMSADLDPLFGATVEKSFDPTTQTMTAASFKDAIASNKNVRILYDEQGNDRIVYTFTDQNTILITTTRAALDKLLQRIQ